MRNSNEALDRKTTELVIKAAEAGILTYLAIINEETPSYHDNIMCFTSPVNTEALKQALRICSSFDMESLDIEFKPLREVDKDES